MIMPYKDPQKEDSFNIKISILNQKYYQCINQNDPNPCKINPLVGFGYFVAYICHANALNQIAFSPGLSLDKHMLSELKMDERKVSFYDNFCDAAKTFYSNPDEKWVSYKDITFTRYPIIRNIIYLLTTGCNLEIASENDPKKNYENVKKRLDEWTKDSPGITNVIMNIMQELCGYEHSKMEIKNNGRIQFDELIKLLITIYEKLLDEYHNQFIIEYIEYMRENNGKPEWTDYLISDGFTTKEQLIEKLDKIVTPSEAKNELMSILLDFTYDQIRKLLFMWTSSKNIIKPPENIQYNVRFGNKFFAYTCFFILEIPNKDKDASKREMLGILDNFDYGFFGGKQKLKKKYKRNLSL